MNKYSIVRKSGGNCDADDKACVLVTLISKLLILAYTCFVAISITDGERKHCNETWATIYYVWKTCEVSNLLAWQTMTMDFFHRHPTILSSLFLVPGHLFLKFWINFEFTIFMLDRSSFPSKFLTRDDVPINHKSFISLL